ncbi:MAG: hypothetical protein JWN76_499 [Chitinophagaceae bacterium]|nr:hypothetical protein [Chitinophagaceae bacterium]
MTNLKLRNLFLLLPFLYASCSPLIYYVGDTFPPTSSIDVYYDTRDVPRNYKTIGHMTKELYFSKSERKQFIKEAKGKGADGIIFSDLYPESDRKSDHVFVKAELIKYQ